MALVNDETPTAFETSAILQTEQLGSTAKFGDCENADDKRPWRSLTDFRVYCPKSGEMRPIEEVTRGMELRFCGTVEPYEQGGGPYARSCGVKDIGPLKERSFQGYGDSRLIIWISTSRAHYALKDPASEYRPLFEPLRTLADLSASVYNFLSENPDISIDKIKKHLPNRLRPRFEHFRMEIARELLDFKYIDLANGARLEIQHLNAVRQMGGWGKGVKRRHSGVDKASPNNEKPGCPKRASLSDSDAQIQQLVNMGYAEKQARKAVKATRGEGLVHALDWLEAKKVEAEIDREPPSSSGLDLPQMTPPGNAAPPVLPSRNSPPGELRTPFPAEDPLDEIEDSSPPLQVNRRGRQNATQGGVRTTGVNGSPCDRDEDHDIEGGVRTVGPCGVDLGRGALQTACGSSAPLQNDTVEKGLEANNHSRETGSGLGLVSGLERNTTSKRGSDPNLDGGGLHGGWAPNRKRSLDSAQLGERGSGRELHVSSTLPLSAQREIGQDSAEDRQTSPTAKRSASDDGSGLEGAGTGGGGADERAAEVCTSGGLESLENGAPKKGPEFWTDDRGSRGANERNGDATCGFEEASKVGGLVPNCEGGFRANQGFGSGRPVGLLCDESLVKGQEGLGVKATEQVSDPGVSGGGRNGNGSGLFQPTIVSGIGSGMKPLGVGGGDATLFRTESENRGAKESASGRAEVGESSQQSSAGTANGREKGSTAQILRSSDLRNGLMVGAEAAELLNMGTGGSKERLVYERGQKTEKRECEAQLRGLDSGMENSDCFEAVRATCDFGRLESNNGLDVFKLPGSPAKTLKPCGQSDSPDPFERPAHFQGPDESRRQESRPEILDPGSQAKPSQPSDPFVRPKASGQSNAFGDSYLCKEPIAAPAQNIYRPEKANPSANPRLFLSNEMAIEVENLESPNLLIDPKAFSANGSLTEAENGPLSEAERLQNEGHTGAILSMLGGEVEILIDAFAIWWEEDQLYYTAKAVDYSPETHRHKVKFFVDEQEEWFSLWKEEVRILQEREDYSGPEDIPLYLERNGKRGPERGRKVSRNEQGGKGSREKRDHPDKTRACTPTQISDELDESEIDEELALEGGDVTADVIVPDGQVAARAGRLNRHQGQFPEEEWRGAVKNGPRTFHFLFENVANANKGQAGIGPDGGVVERENVWEFMQRHLWGIPPEAINSAEFSVAHRKRKYVHNIPRAGRSNLLPAAPIRISEMWPDYYKNFPDWDRRKETDKLNMITTKELHPASLNILNKILRGEGGEMTAKRKALVRSYSLIFTSNTSVANIREAEVERIMGFPKGHTRCGIPRSKIFQALGNSFQVDTIAYLLSPLVPHFRSSPAGISVLSLFDGIGGLGVALHRLQIRIKRYISVEIDEHCRSVVRTWWEKNCLDRTGTLEFVTDVNLLTTSKIAQIVREGPLDLVGGGSPCNNLTGNNRQPAESAGGRSGLLGRDSRLFLEFPRVLNEVERFQMRGGRGTAIALSN